MITFNLNFIDKYFQLYTTHILLQFTSKGAKTCFTQVVARWGNFTTSYGANTQQNVLILVMFALKILSIGDWSIETQNRIVHPYYNLWFIYYLFVMDKNATQQYINPAWLSERGLDPNPPSKFLQEATKSTALWTSIASILLRRDKVATEQNENLVSISPHLSPMKLPSGNCKLLTYFTTPSVSMAFKLL